jgi:hypothetical protein
MNTPNGSQASRPAKTSLEILRERDALATRLRILEAALGAIKHETEHALRDPDVAVVALCRIAAVAHQALED